MKIGGGKKDSGVLWSNNGMVGKRLLKNQLNIRKTNTFNRSTNIYKLKFFAIKFEKFIEKEKGKQTRILSRFVWFLDLGIKKIVTFFLKKKFQVWKAFLYKPSAVVEIFININFLSEKKLQRIFIDHQNLCGNANFLFFFKRFCIADFCVQKRYSSISYANI